MVFTAHARAHTTLNCGRKTMAAALLSFLALGGIYPDGHFDTVTKLTADNKDDVIKSTVDAGKTLFVRFIASEG